LEVQAKHFDMYAELMFQEPEDGQPVPVMNMENTVNMIMRLRPGSKVSALDFASFQQAVFKNHSYIKSQITRIDKMMARVVPYDPEDDLDEQHQRPRTPDVEAKQGLGSTKEPKGADIAQMSMTTLSTYAQEDILAELQKRRGMNVSLPGNLDPSLNTSKMVEAFETLCVPQPETDGEAWSKETYTC